MAGVGKNVRRRNGKFASCEPCRKDKLSLTVKQGYRTDTKLGQTQSRSKGRIENRHRAKRLRVTLRLKHPCLQVAEILRWLKDLPIIEHLVQEYYRLSQSAAIPAPFILNVLASLLGDTTTATSVLNNTSKRLTIPPTTEGSGFHELFTSRQLRLEIIAIIGAIAGKASCFALAHSKVSRHFGPDYQARFPRRMMTIIWLRNGKLTNGPCIGSTTGHRLGELSTTLFELGLHRESKDLPIFLAETRRRIFAAAYQLDKTVATFLGRPPRISIRHSDCKPPLDLADEILTVDNAHLQLITRTLDVSGWNLQEPPVFQRASWIRVRFELSTLREEILELSLRPPSADTAAQLRNISFRSRKTWSSLPKHLRTPATAWREPDTLSVSARLMLTVTLLTHLYDDFLVQRLLLREDNQAQGPLLKVSAQILSTVLTLGTYGEVATVDLRRDFILAILLYGFPSASVLVKALQTQSRTGQPLPYAGSRAALIRDLGVFLSHLESIAKTDKVHGLLCERTSKVLLQILDEVLESGLSSAPFAPSEIGDLPDLISDGLGLLGDEMDFWGSVEPGIVFDQWIL
ncbi:hypothetical protein BO82DRAFT_365431 [Aspergillus uvarum CBS 121591]|uniref:Xylanolytic transcriptional activator regulatory domain-containing protein n=1 Tax=Aspergillus uvarum CBS 121591 TaxID=1448315 RepID=A0A319C9V3_9EURO|nr:hypothetical protein BO82DRAFT_365431 [Aspergillus uvarum CBS 121591]PYH80980.1 hypothetical protein BO82DRAFT_365431 [Aspergillus uvarum CBS 121591]